jgi:hypothetical protein
VHFYLCRDSEKPLGIDIQMLDVGIGMAHFELILSEREQEGHWYTEDPGLECPPRVFYVRTWEALE